ncbi:hypothetical protein ACH4FE_00270 [Streptomyces celluloflavus]|uniref:hypothetical protein n=1 Tax=Streptomyces celluloflavus TaxID=58344 RepID=UPI003795270C
MAGMLLPVEMWLGVSRPLHNHPAKGDLKNVALCDKDDAHAAKQRSEKADLLIRMRERINGKPTTS